MPQNGSHNGNSVGISACAAVGSDLLAKARELGLPFQTETDVYDAVENLLALIGVLREVDNAVSGRPEAGLGEGAVSRSAT